MVAPGCKNRCLNESKTHVDFCKTYTEDYPNIFKKCAACGYTIQTCMIRCYCCNNVYRTKPRGSSRKKTLELIIQSGKTGINRI